MMPKRFASISAALLGAALFLFSSLGLAAGSGGDVPAASPHHAAIVEVARAAMEAELGQPVALEVTMMRAQDGFAFLGARLSRADGTAIDFRATVYRDAIEDGLFDGPQLWALLQENSGAWSVLEHDVGPADAWFFGWPAAHGASCTLLGETITSC